MYNKETQQLIFQKRYDILNGHDTAYEIINIFEKKCPLTDYQKEYLIREFTNSGIFGNLDMPFQVYKWGKSKNKETTLLQRLLTPFILLFICIIGITICPIKWLITGTYTFDVRNKYTNWLYKLYISIFNEKF